MMLWKECISLIKSDLYRYKGTTDKKALLKAYLRIPGFRYSFWLRLSNYHYQNHHQIRGLVCWIFLTHYSYLFGIDLPRATQIGKGFYIGHFSGIVISGKAIIGDNCNISQGVTIGVAGRGDKRGVPVIGNKVYIAPGAKVIGKITIGNNAVIGANAVVTHDVPDNAIVVGIPAKIISYNGSTDYILNPA